MLSDEKADGYEHGFVAKRLIRMQSLGLEKYFYLCGPPLKMDSVEKQLVSLNLNRRMLLRKVFSV